MLQVNGSHVGVAKALSGNSSLAASAFNACDVHCRPPVWLLKYGGLNSCLSPRTKRPGFSPRPSSPFLAIKMEESISTSLSGL